MDLSQKLDFGHKLLSFLKVLILVLETLINTHSHTFDKGFSFRVFFPCEYP